MYNIKVIDLSLKLLKLINFEIVLTIIRDLGVLYYISILCDGER